MTSRKLFVALAALALPVAASSQSATAVDLVNSPSISGSWAYRSTATGSDAAFMDGSAVRRMVIACTSANRVVTISMTSTTAAPSINIYTSESSRALAARFEPRTFQLSADVAARDSLLDSIAFSRGRLALAIAGSAPLVVPAWAEAARVVEDCRG